MPFWAAAPLQPQRDRVALHWLQLYGFETYAPRLRDRQRSGFLVAPFTFVARKKRGQKS
jgi:hypothetical protein